MPYYHVRVTRKSNRTHDVLELDLSENELLERIVSRFAQGLGFICGGEPIAPNDVECIHINRTEEPSTVLLPEIREKRERERRTSNVVVLISDEWYVTKEGEDVTRKFIKFPPSEAEQKPKVMEMDVSKSIFIVHGSDHKSVNELKTMLKEFGLDPLVLHEQASGGLTLAEKLEKYAGKVGFAFVILTPDDVGGQRDEIRKKLGADTAETGSVMASIVSFLRRRITVVGPEIIDNILEVFEPRARQNVIFEMGYFWGMLERKRVCCLLKGNVEKPSDIDGIVYVPFKESVNEAKSMIEKELTEAKYEIKK